MYWRFTRPALLIACVALATLSVGGCPLPIRVANPVFDPDGGLFVGSVDVAITCATPGATIHYTTDGSTPSPTNGTVYNQPVHLTDTTTIRAMAFKAGVMNSHVVDATFTRVPGPIRTLSVSTTGNGTVVLDPAGPQYQNGTSVGVAAVPALGWEFDHWEGDLVGMVNPTVIVMDADKSIKAVFVVPSPPKLYYSSYLGIQRADLDGTDAEVLVPGVTNCVAIAVDAEAGKMYWIDSSNGDLLKRANLDGSSVEVLISGLGGKAIAIDSLHDKLYLVTYSGIERADLDGSNRQTLISSGVASAYGIAVNPPANTMYWIEYLVTGGVKQADLDGFFAQLLISQAAGKALALDSVHGKLYFTTNAGVERADLNGTNRQTLVTTGPSNRPGLAVDPAGGKVYWVEAAFASQIKRANLDGSDVELVIDQTAGSGIAIGPVGR
jgi:hypothetical protein